MTRRLIQISTIAIFVFSNCKTTKVSGSKPFSESVAESRSTPIEGTVNNFAFWSEENTKDPCADNQTLAKFEVKRIDNIPKESLDLKGAFVLEPLTIKFEEGFPTANISQINYLIRFDICEDDDDNMTFRRAIIRKKGYYAFGGLNPVYHQLVPNSFKTSESLKRAIFSNQQGKVDYSGIEMVFIGDQESHYPSYFVKGHTLEDGKSFLTISEFKNGDPPNKLLKDESDLPVVTAGLLSVGNPFDYMEKPAKLDYELQTYEITNENLKLKMVFEVHFANGGYRSRNFENKGFFSIEDTNPVLKKDFSIERSGKEAENLLTITYSHHNLTDAFIFENRENNTTYTIQEGGLPPNTQAKLIIEYKDSPGQPIILDLKGTTEKSE